jgi:ABC-2 type transport system permease protein
MNRRAALSALIRRDLAVAVSYPIPFVLEFASIGFAVVTVWFVAKLVDPAEVPGGYFSFVSLGLAVTALLAGTVGLLAGTIRDEQNRGTLEALVATGATPSTLAMGLSAYPMAASAVSAAAYMFFAAVMGADLELGGMPAGLLAAGLGGLSFAGIGVMSAALTIVIHRAAGIVGWIVAVLGMAAGELFPPDLMPGWLQQLAKFSPVTWLLAALRESLLGSAGIELSLEPLAVLGAMAVAFTVTSVASLGLALRYAKSKGTLGGY